MARNHPARKLPVGVPPPRGPRADLADALTAMRVGDRPLVAPFKDRNRVAQLCRYWGRKLERSFTTRRFGDTVRVYRVA